MISKVDFIISGQGIAGSVLAWELMERGKKIIIFDPGESNATKVASGVINPITGRNYVKTWMADEIIPYSLTFYRNVEKKLNKDFIKALPVYKLFYSAGNINDWSLRAGSPDYAAYLKNTKIEQLEKDKINNEFGAFQIDNAYTLDTGKFISAIKDYLINNNSYRKERFDVEKINFNNEYIQYENIIADKIIFCEGYAGKFNKFFSYLPFNPAKGECLHVKIENFYNDRIINGNYFTLPIENNVYYLGSTNHWEFADDLPTEEGKKELIDGLRSLTPLPFTITDHKAAIRPTVKDRKPLIGQHHPYHQLVIFNGMGTKGISLAPYFAAQLSDFLLKGIPLQKDVNIQRF